MDDSTVLDTLCRYIVRFLDVMIREAVKNGSKRAKISVFRPKIAVF